METQLAGQGRLADYLRPLKSRWWVVVAAVVIATGAIYAYEAHKPNIYTASTLVYYQDPGDPVSGVQSAPQTDRNVLDEATLLYSRGTAAIVARRIGWQGTPEKLLKSVAISSKQGEDFIQITAQAGRAPDAANIANQFGATLVKLLVNGIHSRLQKSLGLIDRELASLPQTAANLAERAQLQVEQNQLRVALSDPPLISKQVDPALAPAAPSSPKPARDAVFALILSLIGAIALVYGMERFDRRLKNPEDMERAYGRPLLSVLPHSAQPDARLHGHASVGREFREPFRVLRTNLELESLDAPPRTIIVSSAMPGEGKSTVVRNLALAFRETGKRVVVVDLDLRHPSLHLKFGCAPSLGITEVLRHEVSLDDAISSIGVGLDPMAAFMLRKPNGDKGLPGGGPEPESAPGNAGGNGTNGTGANGRHAPDADVALLSSGAKPANPAVVLASDRLIEVLDELKARFDIVLIDTAPVLAVSDTVPLLRYADAALFVGRLDFTTRDTARRLIEFLPRVPDLNVLGIVANDLSRGDAAGYGYGYGYGSYGDQHDGDGDGPARSRQPRRGSRAREKTAV